MNITLLSADQEQVFVSFVEIKTHTPSETVQERLLLIVGQLFILVDDELELYNFLSFELILHKNPVGNATVT
jgi:hypothetical protein